MSKRKTFYCPRCRHSDEETVPSRLRCPRCGSAVPREEPGDLWFIEARRRPVSRL